MNMLFSYNINRLAVRLAAIFFILGNLICLLYSFLQERILVLGVAFLIIYGATSIIMFFILSMNMLIHFKDILEHMTAMILFYLNVPIAIFYAYLIF